MSPTAKFTREQIANCAYDIARTKGLDAVTSREVGLRLGCSTRPIFTTFKNMEEVQKEVRRMAQKQFADFLNEALNFTPVFKQCGMQVIRFAKEEPRLFKILFMKENLGEQSFQDILQEIGEVKETCINVVQTDYELTKEEAEILFEQMWIMTYGIAVMFVTKLCSFSEEEIAKLLGRQFAGNVMMIKSGKMDLFYIKPEKKEE